MRFRAALLSIDRGHTSERLQEDYDQLTEAVEQPINRLVTKCRSKDEKGAAGVIKELKANVERLSKSLME